MAVDFKWDLVRAARINTRFRHNEIYRGALATGLDRSIPEDTLIRVLNDAGCPALGDIYNIDNTDLICSEREIYGEQIDQAIIRCKFETFLVEDVAWPTDSAWNIVDSTTTATEETMLDSTGAPIDVTYTLDGTIIQHDFPRLSKFVPLRTLTFQQLIEGRPSIAYLNAIASVNDRTWQGLPKGYWLCAAVSATANARWPIYTELSISFISRQIRDWSSFAVFEDETGRAPNDLDPSSISVVYSSAYSLTQDDTANGFLKVGLYPMQNFLSIFGV
jgi:hypothetical protein